MRLISILLAGFLSSQPCWDQATQDRRTVPKAPQVPDPDRPSRTTPPPKQPRSDMPHGHPAETNPGKPPAPPRHGGDNGWIAPTVVGGVVGAIIAGKVIHDFKSQDHELARNGPQMPKQFSMSGMSFEAFCQGNWPIGLDFILNNGAELVVTIKIPNGPAYVYRNQVTGRRVQARFLVPPNFPLKPTPGIYTISAISTRPGPPATAFVRLFGVGAGVRAVGSLAIDQVHFGPQRIRPKKKEQASYTFHTHTDFDRVRAEFLKSVTAGGEMVSKLEDEDNVDRVVRETTRNGLWNGKKGSPGEHVIQLRGWESALDKANWVIGWSSDQVVIEE